MSFLILTMHFIENIPFYNLNIYYGLSTLSEFFIPNSTIFTLSNLTLYDFTDLHNPDGISNEADPFFFLTREDNDEGYS